MQKDTKKTFRQYFKGEAERFIKDAEKIYNTLRTPNAIRQYSKLGSDEQRDIVPRLYDGYSMNFWTGVIGMALKYALYVQKYIDDVEKNKDEEHAKTLMERSSHKCQLIKKFRTLMNGAKSREEQKEDIASILSELLENGYVYVKDDPDEIDHEMVEAMYDTVQNSKICSLDIYFPGVVGVYYNHNSCQIESAELNTSIQKKRLENTSGKGGSKLSNIMTELTTKTK